MKKIIYVTILLINSCACSNASQANRSNNKTLDMFLKFEMAISKYRDSVKTNKLFLSPQDESYDFKRILIQTSPDLLQHTDRYVNDLLDMLKKNKIDNTTNSNNDIIWLLYNLCIEEYSNAIAILYDYYKLDIINFKTFESAIVQNNHLSNQVGLQYQNEKLRKVLESIYHDNTNRHDSEHEKLQRIIKDVIDGKDYYELKELNTVQPPFFTHKNCQ
jgi:hypothetical protein